MTSPSDKAKDGDTTSFSPEENGARTALQQRIHDLERMVQQQRGVIEELQRQVSHGGSASQLARFFRQTPQERLNYVNGGLERVEVLRLELESMAETEANAAKRLQQVVRRVREFDYNRTSLDQKLQNAQAILLREFEEKADQLTTTFDMYREPHNTALSLLAETLIALMEGKLFEIIAPSELNNPVYQTYLQQVRAIGDAGLDAGPAGVAAYTDSGDAAAATATTIPVGTSQTAETDKIARRWQLASDVLYPMFPSVDLESLVTMLETHNDSIEKTIVRLLDQETTAALREAPGSPANSNGAVEPVGAAAASEVLSQPKSSENNSPAQEDVKVPTTITAPARVGSAEWLASLPRVTVTVLKVRPDLDLEVRLLVDRNGVPVDPISTPVHVFHTLTFFYDLGCRLLRGPERDRLAERYLDGRVPVITFLPNGTTSFSLLSVNPRIPLSQYRMEYLPEEQDIAAVLHVDDGPIRFTAYNPRTLQPPPASQFENIVEIFTNELPNGSLNIAHMHLQAGLPLSDGELHVVYDKSVPGKPNVYHLQLEGRKPVGLSCMLSAGTGLAEIKFPFYLERTLPKVGGYVYVDDQSHSPERQRLSFSAVARLDEIFLGVVADEAEYRNHPAACACVHRVSNSASGALSGPQPVKQAAVGVLSPQPSPLHHSGSFGAMGSSAESSPVEAVIDAGRGSPGSSSTRSSRSLSGRIDRCKRVYMKTMPGLARVTILWENGAVVKPPRRESVHVCKLREADEAAILSLLQTKQ